MPDLSWLILTIAATLAGFTLGYRVARAGRRHEAGMARILNPPAPLWHGATKDQ